MYDLSAAGDASINQQPNNHTRTPQQQVHPPPAADAAALTETLQLVNSDETRQSALLDFIGPIGFIRWTICS